MALPKQVQEAAEKAEELMSRPQEGALVPETDSENPTEPEENGHQVEAPVVEEQQVVETPQAEVHDVYKARYETLQGKYNAEIPRMQQQIAELLQQNQQLASLLSANQGQGGQQAATPGKQGLLSEDEVTEYGDDFIDMIRRIAREEQVTMERKIEGRVEHVSQQVQQTARERLEAKLAELVPDWEKWNVDQGFLAWLDSPDDMTGIRRYDTFKRALDEGRADRLAKYFDTYKRSVGVVAGAAPQPKPKDRLAGQVTPTGKSKGATPPSSSEKKRWTTAEIGAFYNDVAKGKYRGRVDEQKRIHNDIMRAQKEGRIK